MADAIWVSLVPSAEMILKSGQFAAHPKFVRIVGD